MRPIRVLDFVEQTALRSQAVYHGVAAAMRSQDVPVLSLTTPSSPYVCVGRHQEVAREVDEAYCQSQGLPIVRRHVGGGAVYLDSNQLFFHFIYPESQGARLVEELYAVFIEPVVRTYRRFGVQAVMRPINDIHVNGRKIGGTGAATIGTAVVLAGSFMFDFDAVHMSRCLRVSSEKFRDKLYSSMRDYITSFSRELGSLAPSHDAVRSAFIEEIEATLGVTPIASTPTPRELRAIDDWEQRLLDPQWTYAGGRRSASGGVKISADTHLAEADHKAPGGLLRARLLARAGRIAELNLSGDFTCLPEEGVEALSVALAGSSLDPARLRQRIDALVKELQLDMPGVSVDDLLCVIQAAAVAP